MQTIQRYLLTSTVIVYQNGYHGRNSKVYDRRITLHKGVSNPITFTFKNEDQKAQDIASKTYEFNMINSESNKSVVTKTLNILNTVQATSAVILSDGSSTGRTAKATITTSNITGSFVVGYQLKGTTLTGPVTISNVNTNLIDGDTTLTLSFADQTIPSETKNVTAGPKGTADLTVTEGDLLSLDSKFYNFAIREVKSDGSREVTYADTNYVSSGTIEVLDGAYPQFTASTLVSDFTTAGGPLPNTSGAIDALSNPGNNNNKALHTIAVYTSNFSGSLRVQGTMSSSPVSEVDYFDITLDGQSSPVTFSSSSTVTNYNFYGVFHSVRFSWGNDTSNIGVIDKILYRQ